MDNEDVDLISEAPVPGATDEPRDRPPLSPAQSYDPFGSLFDDQWVNDDF